VSGFSTVKYWIENDIDVDDIKEMPIPHYRPITYIKTSILWAFYYLKYDYEFEAAIKDIIKRGGDTQANAAIVGGLIGASSGTKTFNKK
jgi:ADP-ribosyl-[dinitrogen reductase] hydrolase